MDFMFHGDRGSFEEGDKVLEMVVMVAQQRECGSCHSTGHIKWLKGKFCVNVEFLLLTHRVNP